MATLDDLYLIEINSGGARDDVDSTIADAAKLKGKVRVALYELARTLLSGGTINSGSYPSPAAGSDEPNNALGWAQSVVLRPEAATSAALRVALAGAGKGLTSAAILALSDDAIRNAIESLVPRLAKGAFPGRT